MAFTLSGDAATTRTNLGLGDAATKTTGTASGNIPVLDGSGQIASGVLSNAAVADNAITLAKMAGGTDGNLITYDASGDPAYVTTGTSGQVLTSGGTGVAPTFQTAAGGVAGISTSSTSGTAISIDANNIVTYSNRPCFHAAMSGSQTNNGPGTLDLAINSERFDLGADFNTGTYRFTAPVTGKYLFSWDVHVQNLDTDVLGANVVYLNTSNRTYITTSIDRTSLSSDNSELWSHTGSIVVDMDSADTSYIQFHTNGSGMAAQQNYGWATTFTGFLVA